MSKVTEMSQGFHQDERPEVAPGKGEGRGGGPGGGQDESPGECTAGKSCSDPGCKRIFGR